MWCYSVLVAVAIASFGLVNGASEGSELNNGGLLDLVGEETQQTMVGVESEGNSGTRVSRSPVNDLFKVISDYFGGEAAVPDSNIRWRRNWYPQSPVEAPRGLRNVRLTEEMVPVFIPLSVARAMSALSYEPENTQTWQWWKNTQRKQGSSLPTTNQANNDDAYLRLYEEKPQKEERFPWPPAVTKTVARKPSFVQAQPAVRQPPIAPVEVNKKISTDYLIELLRAETSSGPFGPPIKLSNPPPPVLPTWTPLPSSETQTIPQNPNKRVVKINKTRIRRAVTNPPSGNPGSLKFDRSVVMNAVLTVTHAKYSEPYTVWWDASSGTARVDFSGGATSTFRWIRPNKVVKRLDIQVDRAGDKPVRKCGVAEAIISSNRDLAFPALPDLDLFSFSDYITTDDGNLERWQYTKEGQKGELGAAAEEKLSFAHELLVSRAADGYTTPVKYTVTANSSLLGSGLERYEHQYLSVRPEPPAAREFQLDEGMCEQVEQLDTALPEHLARLEPLREFTSSNRDPRYNYVLDEYKRSHNREYEDGTEEAVRKNLIMRNEQYLGAGNRVGAPFKVGSNFLSDRLHAEKESMMGAKDLEENPVDNFPYTNDTLDLLSRELPLEFDWRDYGGVTPVRQQGTCNSCWAFAVTASVEGAVFAATGRLLSLSEQTLVDCGKSSGGKGCKATPPLSGFDFVKRKGLPPLEDYPYEGEEKTCQLQSVIVNIRDHKNVPNNKPEELKVAIRQHAATVVLVDARCTAFQYYTGGLLVDESCIKKPHTKLNHAVVAVGWGIKDDELYFSLKNSWGDRWGEAGYLRVMARNNIAGVLTRPTYPDVMLKDIKLPDSDEIPRNPGKIKLVETAKEARLKSLKP